MINPTNIVCVCDEIILKSEGGVSKIRAKIMIVRNSSVYAVCKSCGIEVAVPLAPSATPLDRSGPPLILRK